MKLFDSIRATKPKLNKFDLSHEKKLSLNMGNLVPILVQEVVPGDRFRVNTEILIRLAPMLAPMMHRVNVYTHFWFVPNRLIWDEWENFITGGPDGTLAPVAPYLAINDVVHNSFVVGSLADYMGVPITSAPAITQTEQISVLPFRAYQLIYDEFYRDQNLIPKVGCSKSSGDQALLGGEPDKLLAMRKRAWEHDYLTSALPWSQRGGDVLLPTSVVYKNPMTLRDGVGEYSPPGEALKVSSNSGIDGMETSTTNTNVVIENIESLQTTINDLRKSVRLQEWLEKNARGGARYVEQILSHFGVVLGDYRAARPVYLGGGMQPIVISEVLSTYTNTGDSIPQGNMSGHGVSVGNQNGFKQSFNEHGFVIGIMSVLPKTAYQQGLHRMWSRTSKLDYYWPEFAHLGEQEIKNKEAYWDGTQADKDGTFGYQSRYAEYKYQNSSVHGDFRSNMAHWHMGRIFANKPVLNQSFVESDPTTRVFAVTDESIHHLYCQMYNSVSALRPMPYFGTPRL